MQLEKVDSGSGSQMSDCNVRGELSQPMVMFGK